MRLAKTIKTEKSRGTTHGIKTPITLAHRRRRARQTETVFSERRLTRRTASPASGCGRLIPANWVESRPTLRGSSSRVHSIRSRVAPSIGRHLRIAASTCRRARSCSALAIHRVARRLAPTCLERHHVIVRSVGHACATQRRARALGPAAAQAKRQSTHCEAGALSRFWLGKATS